MRLKIPLFCIVLWLFCGGCETDDSLHYAYARATPENMAVSKATHVGDALRDSSEWKIIPAFLEKLNYNKEDESAMLLSLSKRDEELAEIQCPDWFFKAILKQHPHKPYNFQGNTVYYIQDGDRRMALAHARGNLLISSAGYLVEEGLLCLSGESTPLSRRIHQELKSGDWHAQPHSSPAAPPKDILKRLHLEGIFKGRMQGVFSSDTTGTRTFQGTLRPALEHQTWQPSDWATALSLIPATANYAGLHSYRPSGKGKADADLFLDAGQAVYATVLIDNPFGKDHLVWMGKRPLGEEAAPSEEKGWVVTAAEDYQMFKIERLLAGKLCETLKNFPFIPCLSDFYATRIGDYLLLAETPDGLRNWLDEYLINNTLGNRPDLVPLLGGGRLDGSLHYFEGRAFGHPDKEGVLRHGPDGKVALTWREQAVQATYGGATGWAWESPELQGCQPVVVPSGEGGHLIFMRDTSGGIGFARAGEQPRITRDIDGEILSDIFHYKDRMTGDDRYVFNTSYRIYVMDKEGADAPGFPIPLRSPANNPMQLIPFPTEGQIGAFVACMNGNIYGFDLAKGGQPLKHWAPLQGAGQVRLSLVHLGTDTESHLIHMNSKGGILSHKKNGGTHFDSIYVEMDFYKKMQTDNRRKGYERLVLSNGKGVVKVVNTKGTAFNLLLDPQRREGRFLLADVIGDERKDYIYMSGKEITLHSYEEAQFPQKWAKSYGVAFEEIFEVATREGKSLIGAWDKQGSRVYLINGEDGKTLPGFPLEGTGRFSLVPISEGRYFLIAPTARGVSGYVVSLGGNDDTE